MELFSEIFSCYYSVVAAILNEAHQSPVSRRKIQGIIEDRAFEESILYIMPRLTGGEWPLLEEGEGKYISVLKHEAERPLSHIERAWMKSVLLDERAQLFFDRDELDELLNELSSIEPLFLQEDFIFFDRAADGDPFEDRRYQNNFREMLAAIRCHEEVIITYQAPDHPVQEMRVVPYKMEYSSKDNKFRAYTVRVQDGRCFERRILNLGRLLKVAGTGVEYRDVGEALSTGEETGGPVLIRITSERNAMERCMLQFAQYEKRTEYDQEKDLYYCWIDYDPQFETELLIQILSFGPMVKVLEPPHFLEQVKNRVSRQWALLGKDLETR